jgi:hypothetical protein
MVEKVIARDEAITRALEKYEYDQKVEIEKLDAKGMIKGTDRLEMVVRPGAQASYTIVQDSSGGKVIPGDATAKQAKMARESEKNKTTFSLRELAARYIVTKAGVEVVAGRKAHVLAFAPKPGLKFKDRTEKVLNRLYGRMWVSTEDYAILKTEAALREPVELAWMFASMKSLEFEYVTQPAAPGMVPKEFRLQFRVEVPFRTIWQRQLITMFKFRPRLVDPAP